ncbi:MAG TPA: hypothetical protein PKZ97_07185 [Azospirillaceae bacterium]|nr:hypothetical protein [Azospirillaceae bacterium]HRQ80886.1 hypothetical protein [Azospirillaceae bacterium]
MPDFASRRSARVCLMAIPSRPRAGERVRLRCVGGRRMRLNRADAPTESLILPDHPVVWVETTMPQAALLIDLLDGNGSVLAGLRLEPNPASIEHGADAPAPDFAAEAEPAQVFIGPDYDDVDGANVDGPNGREILSAAAPPESAAASKAPPPPEADEAPADSQAGSRMERERYKLLVPSTVSATSEGGDALILVQAVGAIRCEATLADGQRALLPAVGAIGIAGPIFQPLDVAVIARFPAGQPDQAAVVRVEPWSPPPVNGKAGWLRRLFSR